MGRGGEGWEAFMAYLGSRGDFDGLKQGLKQTRGLGQGKGLRAYLGSRPLH